MVVTAEECREWAAKCKALAEVATDPAEREKNLRDAQEWQDLAKGISETVVPLVPRKPR